MDLRQFLLALRARYAVAVIALLLSVAAVLAANELMPRQFTAQASVMVDIRAPDPVASLLVHAPILPGSMSTQAEIIKSDRVARKVIGFLKYENSTQLRMAWLDATAGNVGFQDWAAGLLQRGLAVSPSRDSNIINIAYTGMNAAHAAAVANAFAQAYIDASIELKVDPAKQYTQWFGEQAKMLRDQVEAAQARLSAFQRSRGILATDETLDHEVAKLNDLSARLTAAQGETRDAQSKQHTGDAADALPEVLQNSVISGLRTSIAQLSVRLKESENNLGARHPQYLRMQTELEEMRKRLAAETSHVASTYTATTSVGKSREVELRAAIEAQKKKLLDMKKDRDQIAVLQRDVETAKRAYEAVTNRLNQASLESQATKTNVTLLNPAIEPLEPSFPKPVGKMLVVGLALGIVLASACVVGLETLDRRIRTAEDLAQMLQAPVLAVIERGGRRRGQSLLGRVFALPAK